MTQSVTWSLSNRSSVRKSLLSLSFFISAAYNISKYEVSQRTWSYSKVGEPPPSTPSHCRRAGKRKQRGAVATTGRQRTGLESSSSSRGTKRRREVQEESEEDHHIHITHSCTLQEAGRILGHALHKQWLWRDGFQSSL
ncbi:hypothetical protein WMY93_026012 [Mugilogobius chulae]|uniref:Uncharacterized protein n=1 Tax=Mugilogobius chulae TaxID=88201 RepID=A0AAW0N6I6_9GOBI